MSAQNPFQIPSCFKLDIEYRRRERFKKTVVTAVVISVALVIGLLIEGCVNEKSQASSENQLNAAAPTSKVLPDQQSEPPVSKATPANPPLQPCPVAMVPKTATPVAPPHTTGGAVYLVKSGDTLSHIAKTCGTTVKALKSANSLADDRIVVGEKLKIPAA
jgi:LysM repeat protein